MNEPVYDQLAAALPGQLADVEALLAACGLMRDGVARGLDHFLLALAQGRVVACGAIEPCGAAAGLVRSIAVVPELRGRGVGGDIIAALVLRARERQLGRLFLLTEGNGRLFERLGFTHLPREAAPDEVKATDQFAGLCPASARLMVREVGTPLDPALEAKLLFDGGLFCAESVLLALTRHMGIDSPLIPSIATGLCSGIARSSGPCGALTGGILALNLACGRERAGDSVEQNYAQVRLLMDRFRAATGGTGCSELLGCDLATPAGQALFREQRLSRRCRQYTATGAALARELIDSL